MQEIMLDLTRFEEKLPLHAYLKEMLHFPFYYGANLDALNDELTSTLHPLRIVVCYPANPKGKMAEYIPQLLRVFHDAACENYHLEVLFREMPL